MLQLPRTATSLPRFLRSAFAYRAGCLRFDPRWHQRTLANRAPHTPCALDTAGLALPGLSSWPGKDTLPYLLKILPQKRDSSASHGEWTKSFALDRTIIGDPANGRQCCSALVSSPRS